MIPLHTDTQTDRHTSDENIPTVHYVHLADIMKSIPSDAMFSDTHFQYLLQVYQYRMTGPLLHTGAMVIREP